MGRVLAERMKGSLGQPIIIENVGGADGSIGVGRGARATPDGYTLTLGSLSTHVLNGAFYSVKYDILNYFVPVSLLDTTPAFLFAKKTMPAENLNELVVWLKANPNKASAGVVTASYRLLTTFFQKETSTHFTLVPYRGGTALVQDLVAGQIDLAFASPLQLALMRTGIKAYAVASDMRLATAPDIPTFGEMGLPTLSFSIWDGLFTPKDTPKEIIGKLNAAVVEALDDQAVRSRMVDLGYELFPREQRTPEALGALQKADAAKWWPIIKELGIKAE